MSSDGRIERDGTWWRRSADGAWLRWNAFTEEWEPSASAPPPPGPPAPHSAPVPVPKSFDPTSTAAPIPAAPPPTAAPAPPASLTQPKRRLDLDRIRYMLPHWAEGPVGIAIAAGLVVVLLAGTALAYSLVTGDPPKVYKPIEVKPYDGPVSWRGQKDVYDRLKHITGCTPQDIQGIDRDFGNVHTAKGRIKYLTDGVGGMRGLTWNEKPKMHFLKQAELGRQVARIVNKEYDRAQSNLDAEVLGMLGAVPQGTRFGKLKGADAAAAIAGLYLPEKKALYVGDGGNLNTLDELTLAHELTHALTDQAFGLEYGDKATISDSRNALRAVHEGDAELAAMHYDMILDIETELRFVESSPAGQVAADAEYPGYFLERGFFFPYFEGTLFVCELYAINGWEAVNDAYTDPPTTTAEILFPERYIFKIKPKDPTDPPTPDGWSKDEQVFGLGAADLLWLFQAPGGHLQPKLMRDAQAVKRWNGGEIHLYRDGKKVAISMALVDGKEDAKGKKASPPLCKRMERWYTKAFEGTKKKRSKGTISWRHANRTAILACTKEGPRLSIAPDAGTASALSR
jgi:hypothetical protein